MRISLSGNLTYREAAKVLEQVTEQLTTPETVLDMQAVGDVDSSVIALLLAWMRRANERSIILRCERAPDNVLSLAALYGTESLLPLTGRHE
ncbi:phospholipid transport system transporter-binding protein [Chitinivorax tropicus]|uniref:Phospholipid transport system transporter-binding protein n=1 Tax=Chitinivorax tropicus TaxID=714531 RepID=A0A840MSV7_9PROT|nr:STAS domain-containing protein [Chitinivorax tropicus]MBB5019486.1 phospholipid transport system transporter-binding protein [Chitinivorax tropicus]